MARDRRVFIVDDDEAVRESLAALLMTHGYGVTVFASGRDFLERCPDDVEACLIADVRMPEMDGLELQEQVVRRFPRLAVVIVTGHGDVPIAVRAMKAGAADFVEKPFTEEVILAAIGHALSTTGPAGPATARPGGRERLAQLTTREHEVLLGLVAGLPNKTIAYDLGISPRTVEVHRARVMDKMEARSLSALVRIALEAGIAPGDGTA